MSIIDSPDIFEFDLKKFFDRVNIQYISKKLLEIGTPSSVVTHLENINKSTPAVCGERIDEGVEERNMLMNVEADPSCLREGL